jgi:DNA-binding MarR family transcriptional regulator
MTAILAMERSGLVTRVRNEADRRKQNIYLTPKARQLKATLLPLAQDVVSTATSGFTAEEIELTLQVLGRIQANLEPLIPEVGADADPAADLP